PSFPRRSNFSVLGRSTAVGTAVVVVFACLRSRCSSSGARIWFRVIAALASSSVVVCWCFGSGFEL
ncbi:hypothetical protein A2U01_0106932, partial [Trifolium medium]|nr:hypothetical protein [Trifolium medium]